MKRPNLHFRNCKPNDIKEVRHLVSLCKPLALHAGYTYWMLFHYFNQSCFFVTENNKLVGYISGMKSNTYENTFFVWQIGIVPECRGKGYAYFLIEKAVEAAKKLGCNAIQFTIEPDNEASFNAFNSFAKKNNLEMTTLDHISYPHSVREIMEEEIIYQILI